MAAIVHCSGTDQASNQLQPYPTYGQGGAAQKQSDRHSMELRPLWIGAANAAPLDAEAVEVAKIPEEVL